MRRAADKEPQGLAHRAEIGAEIDDVGDEQERNDCAQQPGRIMAPDVAGNPMPGDAADPRADFLNRGHQRPGEQHYPSHVVAELRAGLRIGRDAARIVV
jgi:hypothetical protein